MQLSPAGSKKISFFLSICYIFWYFADRNTWNINHVDYPAPGKGKSTFLLLVSDSSLSNQTSVTFEKKKKQFNVRLAAASFKLSKEKVKHGTTCSIAESKIGLS